VLSISMVPSHSHCVISFLMLRWHCCRTVYEEIGEGADMLSINGREISLRAYCSQFNFRGGDQQARACCRLSGSTVRRVHYSSGLQDQC
jgi:energy-dependent translational throttle protein EttA